MNQSLNQSTVDYDSAVNEAERRLLSVSQQPTVDCKRLRTSPSQKSPFRKKSPDENESLLDSQLDQKRLATNLRDINAMSVASVYDGEYNEVNDADQ